MNDERDPNGKPGPNHEADPGAAGQPEQPAAAAAPRGKRQELRPHVMAKLREFLRRRDAEKAAMDGPLATDRIQ